MTHFLRKATSVDSFHALVVVVIEYTTLKYRYGFFFLSLLFLI